MGLLDQFDPYCRDGLQKRSGTCTQGCIACGRRSGGGVGWIEVKAFRGLRGDLEGQLKVHGGWLD